MRFMNPPGGRVCKVGADLTSPHVSIGQKNEWAPSQIDRPPLPARPTVFARLTTSFSRGGAMGIINFVKGGVKELAIARPDEAKGDIIYKHPDQTIPMKAQLTVDSDELALFFKDGKFVGQFGPGRHTLDGASIPFLGQLVDKFTDGNVFLAEIFFVNTREMTDVKFGGQIGKVRDVQSGLLVQMMVHGTFSARVIDPPKLVIGLVGL